MSNIDLNLWIKEKVKSLKAYHVENFDCDIKLHANENSFPAPPEIMDRFLDTFKAFELNRYPDPDCGGLKKIIAQRTLVPPESLVIGNGSDELIQILLQIFCDMGDTVAFPDPTFAMYAIIAKGMGLNVQTYSLNDQWDFKAEPFLKSLEEQQPRIVFLSYPNNPTGNCFNHAEVLKMVEQFPGIVVVDEAYYDFAKLSFIEEISRHNNLVVLRSLSKIGLAGLRVGFGAADPQIIEQINKIRLPYNANMVSQGLAEVMLQNFEPVQKQIDQIVSERDRLAQGLTDMGSITVFPSDANFLLFRADQGSTKVFKQLVKRSILIRDLSGHPRLKNCLRVTVGTPQENDEFMNQLKEISN